MAENWRSLRVEGITLRHKDWGEADRLLSIFTRELGKVQAIAKGVRKPRSRKAGHLEPFMRASMLLARGRSFFILTQAEAIDAHIPLREDLTLLGRASYLAELLDRFTFEEEANPALYRLMQHSLTRLERGDHPAAVLHFFEMRLLDQVGYRPQLQRCGLCGQEIRPQDQFFSAAHGSALCPACGEKEPQARPVSLQALKYLRHFQRSTYAEARRARFAPATLAEVEALMYYYLTYLLESSLHSPAFIQRIRQHKSRR